MKLEITESILATAKRSSASRCVLALAGLEAGLQDCRCDGKNLYHLTDNGVQEIELPIEGIRIATDWDAGRTLTPQTLHIPEPGC